MNGLFVRLEFLCLFVNLFLCIYRYVAINHCLSICLNHVQ